MTTELTERLVNDGWIKLMVKNGQVMTRDRASRVPAKQQC